MSSYLVAMICGYAAVIVLAFSRSRAYGVFSIVLLAFPTWVGLALRPHLGGFGDAVPWLQAVTYLHFGLLIVFRQMRPWVLRVTVSIPALWFVSATFLALPWALLTAFGIEPYGAFVPFVLCAGGLVQSLWTREETVDFHLLGERHIASLCRFPQGLRRRHEGHDRHPLRIVQITDPHLGPFMSVARLHRICRRAVDRHPDLIVLTGDIMTMESRDIGVVIRALAPLAEYRGRVFACHGNHDHEARDVVEHAYRELGIELLVDRAVTVQTHLGPVEILGLDFVWNERQAHIQAVTDAYPPPADGLRVILLHDPGAFRYIPSGHGNLVLSGHTHGGQLGLVSVGLPHTFVSLISSFPDHGPWALGSNRLYVHRAQGHYGFPIRLGVPGEQSVLQVWT